MGQEIELDILVRRAASGDEDAIEAVVRHIQDRLYNLSLKMLWHPDDAQDATQEILIQIVTHLNSFRGESTFMTWAYRIASNYLLKARKRRAERQEMSFEIFGERIDSGISFATVDAGDEAMRRLLDEEIKVGCTHGMLLCLDREHRITYILGEIFEVSSAEGAFILDVTPAAFRKRLSRARSEICAFMRQKCGLVNPDAPCRCSRQIETGIKLRRVNPDKLLFADRPITDKAKEVRDQVRQIEELQDVVGIYRSHPEYAAPEQFTQAVRHLLNLKEYTILQS